MKTVIPITPEEVEKEQPKRVHPGIIEVVNDLLIKNYSSGRAELLQDEIVNEFLKRNTDFTRDQVFKEKHLDFESIFNNAGWDVVYDKPAYFENYEPSFVFRRKRK